MQFQPDNLSDISLKMDAIKVRSSGGFFTNYFQQPMVGNQLLSAQTDHSILFLNDEFDFYRLFYFTNDLPDLGGALKDLELSETTVASYLNTSLDERIPARFLESGFEEIATFQRMINNGLPIYRTNRALRFAEAGDLEELYQGLFTVFNKYTDRLPTKDRLANFIAKQQVLVNRNQDGILGCVVFQIQRKRVNVSHLYNRSDNNLDTLMLLSNFYGLMHERGIRSGFLWVNSTNLNVIKMQRTFGWIFDGVQDRCYLKRGVKR